MKWTHLQGRQFCQNCFRLLKKKQNKKNKVFPARVEPFSVKGLVCKQKVRNTNNDFQLLVLDVKRMRLNVTYTALQEVASKCTCTVIIAVQGNRNSCLCFSVNLQLYYIYNYNYKTYLWSGQVPNIQKCRRSKGFLFNAVSFFVTINYYSVIGCHHHWTCFRTKKECNLYSSFTPTPAHHPLNTCSV